MAFQVDIIPATGTDYFTTNIEDGIALADASLREAFAGAHPEAWSRIEARRAFMADAPRDRAPPRRAAVLEPAGLPAAVPAAAGPGDDGRLVSAVARGAGPAGPVLALGDDHIALEILPDVGARIHRLRYDGRDLILTPSDVRRHLDDPWFWGSYPMAPWCNRVEPGRSTLAGHELDLPVNFRDGTSIHGQVSQAPWQHVEAGTFRIRAGGDGWPWPYEVEQRFAVEGDVLRLDLDLTNLGDDAMPAGIGFHPWWVKPLEVAFAAERVHRSNLATDPEPVPVDGPWDLRALAPMPENLDATWVDIGEPPIRLAWPEANLGGDDHVRRADAVRDRGEPRRDRCRRHRAADPRPGGDPPAPRW